MSLADFYEKTKNEIKKCSDNNENSNKIEFEGDFIAGNLKFKDMNILEEDYLFLDIKDNYYGWNFFNHEIPKDERCEGCYKYQ